MWREVRREARGHGVAVVAGVGPHGTPVSVRVPVRVDDLRRLLVIADPGPVGPGPASVLFHRHDERLWKLRSSLTTGTLVPTAGEWWFLPSRFVPGLGIGGPLSYVRLLLKGRRNTARYLKARGLARPAVAWEEIADLVRRAEDTIAPLSRTTTGACCG